MVRERITRRHNLPPFLPALLLGISHPSRLRRREDHLQLQPVVHPLPRLLARHPRRRVLRRHLPLLDRQMHHLVWPAHVPRREDMRHIRLLRGLRDHLSLLRLHSRRPQCQPVRIRFPPQRLQNLLRLHASLFSVLHELHPLLLSLFDHPLDLGSAKDFTSLVPKHLGQSVAHLGVRLRQQPLAPLDHRHLHSQMSVVLRKLQRHRPSSQHDQASDRFGCLQALVARPIACLLQTRNLPLGRPRSGRHQKRLRLNLLWYLLFADRLQGQPVRTREPPLGPVKGELPHFQLLPPVIRKLCDQLVLPLQDLLPVRLRWPHPDPKLPRPADLMVAVRALQHRLGRHTAPQDAQPAHPLAALDHRHLQPQGRRRPGRRITRAPCADHGQVINGGHEKLRPSA